MTVADPGVEPTASATPEDAVGRKRLWLWLTVAGAILLLAIVGVLVAVALNGQPSQPGPLTGETDTPGSSGPGSTDPSETATSTPSDPDATIDPRFGEPVADTAVGDGTADFGDNVTARLTEVTPTTVTGTRAGEVSGPAIRVTVELSNATSSAIDLGTVTVNAYFGADTQPASPFDSATEGEPFTGSLAAGAKASGTYVFSVPEGQDDALVVTVSKDASSPLVTFTR